MQFSARSTVLLDGIRQRTVGSADGEPVGGIAEIAVLFLDIASKFAGILAACKAPTPPTPPVPDALSAVGVTSETWHQAVVAKYGAEQSVAGDGFKKVALRRTIAEIRKSQKIKKKAAVPLALSVLQAGRDETVEDIAIAAQGVKDNRSHFGG